MPSGKHSYNSLGVRLTRQETLDVKRYVYSEGITVNKFLATLIRQAMRQVQGQVQGEIKVARPAPVQPPHQERFSRELVRDREAEQSARLPVGKPAARPVEGDRRPMFSEARK